jgi:hypothetical protein
MQVVPLPEIPAQVCGKQAGKQEEQVIEREHIFSLLTMGDGKLSTDVLQNDYRI